MSNETVDVDLELEGLDDVESEGGSDDDGDIAGTGETTDEATGEEPTAADAEAKAKAEADAKAKVEAEAKAKELYDRFLGAIEEALAHEGYDSSTGTIPTIAVSAVSKVYLDMNAKTRKAAKQYTVDKMQDALQDGDFQRSRSYMQLNKALGEAKPEPIVKPPVDPTDEFVASVTVMRLAPNFMTAPAGVADDWAERVKALGSTVMTADESGTNQVQKYLTWLSENEGKDEADRTPEPDVHDVVKRAAQMAKGRVRVARAPKGAGGEKAPRAPRAAGDGTKRNIGEHIRQAFEGHPVGTFLTVAEIVKFQSTEYAGTDGPSAGAVNARLFPASGGPTTLAFVRAEGTAEGRPQKGAVKTA